MEKLEKDALRQCVPQLANGTILVVGDIIVDHFVWGRVSRISPEAPVPVVDVDREDLLLGGAANVLHNIYSLGGRGILCGIVGDDAMAANVHTLLAQLSSPTRGVVKANDRPTMVKTRIVAHNQQVVRFDREKRAPMDEPTGKQVLAVLDEVVPQVDAVVISDYNKGLITPPVMEHLRTLLARRQQEIPVLVDPKPGRLPLFAGATIITPNHHEAEQMSGVAITDRDSLARAAASLLEKLACKAVLITMGEAGMGLLEQGKELVTIATRAREVYDVTGAGDTVVAVLALGLAAGLTYDAAASLANYAAGIVVGKVGTATVSGDELMEVLQ